ncbi:hypothetical protein [Spirosoma oryzicola]|uniref:hypothetical protein n=1 Tax=Spirosoma oryzicola TaxID=2898794 RepID=UPI001E3441D7|nr:hypothetical protein [Spirosoma oryzicola]UHG93373.1 hypothetical protein LQ777_10820 [Spirosoma oryzicola]
MDYYIKSDTRKGLMAALAAAGLIDGEGNLVMAGENFALQYLGKLYDPPIVDEFGVELAPAQLCTGWHANFRLLSGDLPDVLRPLVMKTPPTTPLVVWF